MLGFSEVVSFYVFSRLTSASDYASLRTCVQENLDSGKIEGPKVLGQTPRLALECFKLSGEIGLPLTALSQNDTSATASATHIATIIVADEVGAVELHEVIQR